MSFYHLTMCSARSITTADILWRDVLRDQIPQDSETREHFGFTRCRYWGDEGHLLGLYQGLIRVLGIGAIQLNEWREKGILVSKIIEAFSELAEYNRGAYFSWFLQNQHILDNSTPYGHWRILAVVFFAFFFFFPFCIVFFGDSVNANLT